MRKPKTLKDISTDRLVGMLQMAAIYSNDAKLIAYSIMDELKSRPKEEITKHINYTK